MSERSARLGALVPYSSDMGGKEGAARDGLAVLIALTDEILKPIVGADLDETERRLKLATLSVKLRQSLVEATVREAQLNGEDETLDAAGEERLREELYHRLVALARAIDEEEAAETDPTGPGATDRDGLAAVGPSGAETARRRVEQLVVPGWPRRGKDPRRG